MNNSMRHVSIYISYITYAIWSRKYAIGFLAFVSLPALAQQRPLVTEDVEPVKPGNVRFDAGFDLLLDKDYQVSGLNGNLERLGVVSLTFGLASNVEAEIGGPIRNRLEINRQYRSSSVPLQFNPATATFTSDTGDFFLATKIKIRSENGGAPGLGFRFGVELPNSNQARGIGLNQTNFFAQALVAKSVGKARLIGNLGLGILSSPVAANGNISPFTQNDVALFGLAGSYEFNSRFTLVSEVNGRYSTRRNAPLGTESDGATRLGLRIRVGKLFWDVAGIRGVYPHSESGGVTFGVTYQAGLFRPAN
ncbi:MAG: hypothetical protein J2P21_08535 [Chloracidobacterium sp.]|nr:hypothetical protein [Chloracidobacterium sp.]